ncbi:hypothetical protein BV25DRAFT_877277 [Artomyces pyxidatus]|uniref:Uncharacterized protein n=1 Tax=Artomyces pyxidatus TaxID=48021 RepID=A0ACB8THA6_9AGAM|nr:hypothetical protein BV25DRAFT_877277 [Artomyces pyxidatus]
MKVTTDGASAGSTTTFVSTGSHINDKPKRPRSHKQRMGSSTITLASSGTKRSKPDGGDASASSIAFVETFNGAQLDLVTSTPRSPRIGSSVSARAHAEEAITRPSLFPHDSGTFLVDAELARRGFPSTDIRHSPVDSFEAAVSKRLHSSSPSSGNKPLNSRNFDLARHPTSTSLETSSTLPFFGGKAIVPSRSSADFDSTLPIVPAIGSSAVVFKSPVTGHDALGLLRTLPISFQERGPGQDVANDITSPLVAPTLGRGGSAKSSPSYMRIPGTDPNQGKSLDPAAAVSVRSDSSKFHDTPRTAPPPAHAPPSTPTVPLTPTHIPPPRVSSEPVISYNPIVQYGPGPSHLSSVSRDLPTPSPAHAMSPTKPIATQQSLARDLDTDSSRIIAPYAHSKIAPASHPLLPPSRTATPGSRPEPPPTVTAPSEKRGSWFRRHIVDPLKNVLGT